MRFRVIGVALLAGILAGVGCSNSSSHDDNRTGVAVGTYMAGAVEHVAPPSSDLITAAGGAVIDGRGHSVITVATSRGQNVVDSDTFWIDLHYRVAPERIDAGAITPDGEFMFRVRRVSGPAIWFFQREVGGAATSLVSGTYHYVGYRHVNGGPGLLTAYGAASFTGSGGYAISATLSNNTSELRGGAYYVTGQGNVAVVEGSETYVGFTDPEGNVVGWLDPDLGSGSYVRMDLFVRAGSGMHQASLNGTYNLGRFFQSSLTETPGSGFGTITFDGQGGWSMEYTDHDSVVRTDSGSYVIAPDGAATLTSASGTLRAYLSPNPGRRVLFIADTDVTNGEIGFFVATDR
jgi:hypothetical protein